MPGRPDVDICTSFIATLCKYCELGLGEIKAINTIIKHFTPPETLRCCVYKPAEPTVCSIET